MNKAWLLGAALVSVGACATVDDGGGDVELETSETSQPVTVRIGEITENGMTATFHRIDGITGLSMARLVGIAACDKRMLYAVQTETSGYSMRFSNDGGQSWRTISATPKGGEIACDHGQLATLDSVGDLHIARTQANGELVDNVWTKVDQTRKVDRLQGGDGSFYGVRFTSNGNEVYAATNRAIDRLPTWGSRLATIGAIRVTGAGTVVTGHDNFNPGDSLAWPRRAFALEANGTIARNDTLLDGDNYWSPFDTGNERYAMLTAAGSNVLFAVKNVTGGKQLHRITIDEASCSNGVDDDADGRKDSEDEACMDWRADIYCASKPDGTYCSNRYEPAFFLGQANQNAALIRCEGGSLIERAPGVCEQGNGTGIDRLVPLSELGVGDPSNMRRYCNVHWSDGTWELSYGTSDPCAPLLDHKPNLTATIVRAGLYSTDDVNHGFVKCDNGTYGPISRTGQALLSVLEGGVGKTNNRCIFQISPARMRVFEKMYDDEAANAPWTTLPFIHNHTGSQRLDRYGVDVGGGRKEPAYDHNVSEGRPLYAMAGGVVVTGGSRTRDVSWHDCHGSSNQEEVYVRYRVGSNSRYAETFVVYYAHLRKRLVVDGQTVKAGQILGFVGTSGCTNGQAHMHSGVFRLSNTNAHSPPNAGYHVTFQPNDDQDGHNLANEDNQIDALGWANGSMFDPWAYTAWTAGQGAWSMELFKPGHEFSY